MHCEQEYLLDKDTKVNYKILIVEDSEFISKTVYKTLDKQSCYSLDQAFDLKEASQKLKDKTYDFIILDLNLPDAYGEELLIEIKKLSDAKVIILTAEADKQIRESLYRIGILDYVVKDKKFSRSISSIDKTMKSLSKNIYTNILIIDDSMFLCKQLQKILSISSYNTDIAYNAKDGLEKLNTKDINLIILDMELPDKHGLEVLEEIKTNDRFSHIPVIVISGHNDAEIVRNAFKTGASYFITKPFNTEEFTLKVNIAIDDNRNYLKILSKQKIIDEYRTAIIDSTIVSRTDTNGVITFANDKFCEISGYTEEELVGYDQNKIRHPDMPASAFKEMWKTIKNKKPWTGKIKNLKKDGTPYYVQSTINPIVDYNGNIVEYIGIRTDITEIEKHKIHLSNELNFNKEYIRQHEEGINAMVPIIKTDINNIINFANEAFIKISGYKIEDLIGMDCSKLRSGKQTIAKDREEKRKQVMQNKTMRKVFTNVTKKGDTFVTDVFFYPIVDEDKNVVEVLHIMNDITKIYKLNQEIKDTQKEIIYKAGEIGENRSQETGNHVKRVAEYSRILALLAGLGEEKSELIFIASPMHDIGKVGIPDSILNKPGKLTDEEWVIMQTHSKLGFNILKGSKRPLLKAAAIVAYTHHEKWDGFGYPNGTAGEKIHVFGRITAIADVFDALGSDRVYKKAWKLDKILDLFKEGRGKHFDPKLVDLFLDNIDKFLLVRDKFQD